MFDYCRCTSLPSGGQETDAGGSDAAASSTLELNVVWSSNLAPTAAAARDDDNLAAAARVVPRPAPLAWLPPPPVAAPPPTDGAGLRVELAEMRARLAALYDPRVISPNNPHLARWDAVTIAALVFTAIVTPVEVAFVRETEYFSPTPLALLNRLVDAIFVVDMGVQLHLAYVNELGKLVRARPAIRRHYLRGWCVRPSASRARARARAPGGDRATAALGPTAPKKRRWFGSSSRLAIFSRHAARS